MPDAVGVMVHLASQWSDRKRKITSILIVGEARKELSREEAGYPIWIWNLRLGLAVSRRYRPNWSLMGEV